MSETPGVIGQMRPLPEPVNEGQLNSLLQLDRVVSSKLVVCRSLYKISPRFMIILHVKNVKYVS